MKPVIGTVALGAKTVYMREGARCELHHLEGEALVSALVQGLHRQGGVDVCEPCIGRARAHLHSKHEAKA